ncbi:hypothetical protein KOM00_06730 [Geomonas sp. Red69]|uniref:pilus assembly protein TadG-related protein n=1 Tax=Geomonas diazotrophica TaxID=2843197 RepID=UPI001C0F6AFF|nr:pilus assembly protein TadG-related protein [Geomonas diazotrophica]MBU5636427.1 hypothetical protein [Geomonas diazotrophica]
MDAFRRVIKSDQKGFALVYIALMVVVLFAFVGLAVDMGHMYLTKGQLQNAADAGALAGVSQLPNVTVARQTAKQFTETNKAAGETVKVDLNNTNSVSGDIVVGYWDKNSRTLQAVVPAGKMANAVKVMTRRTSESGAGISTDNKPVDTFFARVMNWDTMAARAEAIACRPPKPSAPVVLCKELCTKPAPFRVYFNQAQAKDPAGVLDKTYTVGWTEFSATSKATDLGKNSTVAKLIDGRQDIPLGLCDLTLYSNNGLGLVKKVLHDTFIEKRTPQDSTGTWTILVPIFDVCPAVSPSAESYTTLAQFAEIVVSDVNIAGGGGGSSDGYVQVESITCQACATTNFLGDKAALVK